MYYILNINKNKSQKNVRLITGRNTLFIIKKAKIQTFSKYAKRIFPAKQLSIKIVTSRFYQSYMKCLFLSFSSVLKIFPLGKTMITVNLLKLAWTVLQFLFLF